MNCNIAFQTHPHMRHLITNLFMPSAYYKHFNMIHVMRLPILQTPSAHVTYRADWP